MIRYVYTENQLVRLFHDRPEDSWALNELPSQRVDTDIRVYQLEPDLIASVSSDCTVIYHSIEDLHAHMSGKSVPHWIVKP